MTDTSFDAFYPLGSCCHQLQYWPVLELRNYMLLASEFNNGHWQTTMITPSVRRRKHTNTCNETDKQHRKWAEVSACDVSQLGVRRSILVLVEEHHGGRSFHWGICHLNILPGTVTIDFWAQKQYQKRKLTNASVVYITPYAVNGHQERVSLQYGNDYSNSGLIKSVLHTFNFPSSISFTP